MKPLTKGLLIGGTILLVGGIYFFLKKKRDSTLEGDGTLPSGDEPKDDTLPIKGGGGGGGKPPIKILPTKINLVKAMDLLAGNVNSGNGKLLYSAHAGLSVFNLAGKKAFITTKNQKLGTISSASKHANGKTWVIRFTGDDGVKYQTFADGKLIQN
jgi:hypothetical protein